MPAKHFRKRRLTLARSIAMLLGMMIKFYEEHDYAR